VGAWCWIWHVWGVVLDVTCARGGGSGAGYGMLLLLAAAATVLGSKHAVASGCQAARTQMRAACFARLVRCGLQAGRSVIKQRLFFVLSAVRIAVEIRGAPMPQLSHVYAWVPLTALPHGVEVVWVCG
jgi:hypothetical protein